MPSWRETARAGIPLAAAKAAADPAPKPGSLVTSAAMPPAADRPMLAIVRPHVRDRWLASQLSFWTPQQVENTCRGAMAGNLLAQWLMFDLMEQSWPRLSKNLNELKNAVIDLDWNLQPYALSGQKPSAEAQRRAEIMEGLCWQMKPEVDADERDFEDTLFDIMDDIGKGIEVSEILWMAPGDPQNTTGLWAPRATKWVHPRYYGYQPYPGADDRLMLNVTEIKLSNPELNRLNGFSGTASAALPNATLDWANAQYARFPKDQFLVSIFKQKSGHPISGALLRILAFGWAASNFAWEWALNLAQIFGLPIRWATYAKDANLQTISAIEDMLSNMGSAGWAAFPEGTKLELFKALESARDNPSKAFIDAWDIICDIVVLGQTLTTSQGERGSQALGTIHKDVRDEKIQAVAKRTAKVLNGQFLPAICRLNFGDDRECPWFQPSSKASKDLTTMATRYKTILSIPGVEVSKQQFYEDNELVVPEADDDVLIGQGPSGSGQGGQDSTGGSGSGQDDGVSETPTTAVAKAKSAATDQLVNNVLEDLTGVEAKWLAGAKPFFRELVAKAKDKSLSDGDFVAALEKAKKEIPELFSKLDGAALAKAFYASMSAAVVNGAVRGFMRRPVGFTVRPHPQERGLNRPGGAR